MRGGSITTTRKSPVYDVERYCTLNCTSRCQEGGICGPSSIATGSTWRSIRLRMVHENYMYCRCVLSSCYRILLYVPGLLLARLSASKFSIPLKLFYSLTPTRSIQSNQTTDGFCAFHAPVDAGCGAVVALVCGLASFIRRKINKYVVLQPTCLPISQPAVSKNERLLCVLRPIDFVGSLSIIMATLAAGVVSLQQR